MPNQSGQKPNAPSTGTEALINAALAAGKNTSNISWPSKGVDYYTFLGNSSFSTTFEKPTDWGKKTSSYGVNKTLSMQSGNLQIAEDDIGWSSHTGRYQWQLKQNNALMTSGYAEIAPSTGNLGDTTMGNMLNTPSQFGPGWAVSYGFYDSGSGIGGLTNQDQSYVYATPDMRHWMGDLVASAGSKLAQQPFSVFALPGAHDSGMFDPTCVAKLLGDAAFVALLAGALGLPVATLASLSEPSVMRAIINLAFTQKDTITTMLNLGVRYFDFRPGYCYDNITAGIYQQHNFIPGYPYQSLLQDLVRWLVENPTEIVVVSLNFQGFNQAGMKPQLSILEGMVASALLGSNIVAGDKSDLSSTYQALCAANNRLLFVSQIGASDDASKYDSYNGSYTTANANNIITALNGMTRDGQSGNDYTVLQLQGTASGIGGGIFDSIVTLSNASSPLMSTKPGFDSVTYEWLNNNVVSKLGASQLVVFLNDFCDNALASIASSITASRSASL